MRFRGESNRGSLGRTGIANRGRVPDVEFAAARRWSLSGYQCGGWGRFTILAANYAPSGPTANSALSNAPAAAGDAIAAGLQALAAADLSPTGLVSIPDSGLRRAVEAALGKRENESDHRY